MLKEGALDRLVALLDTRTGAAFEDLAMGTWLIKLLTRPPENKADKK